MRYAVPLRQTTQNALDRAKVTWPIARMFACDSIHTAVSWSTPRESIRATGLRRLLPLFIAGSACTGVYAQALLQAPTESASELGYAVALDGQRIVTGAPGAQALAGRVYTYDCVGQNCSAPTALAPGDLVAGDRFGAAVSVSAATLAIGAPGKGAVYVYLHDGIGWLQQQKLVATPALPNELFGASVALRGNRLAIGAPGANSAAGAIYVFERSGSVWTQSSRLQAGDADPGDALGSSIALDSDTILAGAPYWAALHPGAFSQGAAYVFVFSSSIWNEQARLLPVPTINAQVFGKSVSLSGNRALVGAPLANLRAGSAYVFERGGSTWTQQQQLTLAGGLPGDRFGWSVALDADQLLIGAPFALAGCGGSTRFVLTGGTWNPVALPSLARPAPGGLVGWSIAAEGQRWLVGTPGYSGAPSHVGAAYWRAASDAIFNDSFDDASAATCVVD